MPCQRHTSLARSRVSLNGRRPTRSPMLAPRPRVCWTGPGMTTHPVILKSPSDCPWASTVRARSRFPDRPLTAPVVTTGGCCHQKSMIAAKSSGGTNPRLITYPNSRNWSTSAGRQTNPIRARRIEVRSCGGEVKEWHWLWYGKRLPDPPAVVLGGH